MADIFLNEAPVTDHPTCGPDADARQKTPHQRAMKGLGRLHVNQCQLCHGLEMGVRPQSFPVGKRTYYVSGVGLCDRHMARLAHVAHEAGVEVPRRDITTKRRKHHPLTIDRPSRHR